MMRRPAVRLAQLIVVTVIAAATIATAARPAAAETGYTPLATPVRLLDTRPGPSSFDGQEQWDGLHGQPSAPVRLPVGGRAGVPVGARSVVLNVTATGAAAPGFVTVYPCDATLPTASNLNYAVGETIANSVIVRVPADGLVCLAADGATYLIVDVAGYFADASALVPLNAPSRLLDTRRGSGSADQREDWDGLRDANSPVRLPVTGRAGVPAGAASVVLNVTATDVAAEGYLTVYPCDAQQPTASNLNFLAGDTIANSVISRIAPDGTVCFYVSAATNLVVDVGGYFPGQGTLVPLAAPARLLDSRAGTITADRRFQGVGARRSGSTLALAVNGRASVPGTATAVVLNVTATAAQDEGYVTVFAPGGAQPTASNLNYAAGDTVANSVIARVGADGVICIFTEGVTDLIVDVAAYIVGGPAPSGSSRCADPSAPVGSPSLGEGLHLVGSALGAGRYRAAMRSDRCFWQRQNATGTSPLAVIGLGFADYVGPVTIDVRPTDVALRLGVGCGVLSPYVPPARPIARITAGSWVVGTDVSPGVYQAPTATAACFYQRVSSFDGSNEAAIDEGDPVAESGPIEVVIRASDAGFITLPACGVWNRVG